MKKIFLFTALISLALGTSAQVTQDFNSGSVTAVRGNCWQVWGFSVLGGGNAPEVRRMGTVEP